MTTRSNAATARTTPTFLAMVLATLIPCATPALAQAQAQRGSVEGHVDLGGADPREVGVVVYLEIVDAPKARAKAPEEPYRMRQANKQFTPRLLVIPVDSKVDFPNDDRIFHNVFSLSRTERFDLGLYRSGSSKSVVFDREGVVDVYCNIHPQMVAQILVLETPYHDIVDEKGKFRIQGVPAGKYEMVVWQRHQEPLRLPITVAAGEVIKQRVSMEAGNRPRRHMRKDGQPYGRYR